MAACAMVLGATATSAQQTPPLAFDVTLVKPNRTGDRSSRFQLLPGGRFVATNTTVRALLQAAYRFDYLPFQLIGGPWWLDAERFAVEGRGSASASPAEFDAMLRSLLVSRFKMTYVRETRDMPVYHLVGARADGRAGPQLRPSSKPCDRTPALVNLPAPDPNATIDELTQRLSGPALRIVVNRSKFEGIFDYEPEYTPDNNQPAADAAADTGLALFTALQEQLGLRLEPARGPVDVLVIESAERPEEN